MFYVITRRATPDVVISLLFIRYEIPTVATLLRNGGFTIHLFFHKKKGYHRWQPQKYASNDYSKTVTLMLRNQTSSP